MRSTLGSNLRGDDGKLLERRVKEEDETPLGNPTTTTSEPHAATGNEGTEWRPKWQEQDENQQGVRNNPVAKPTLTCRATASRPACGFCISRKAACGQLAVRGGV